MKLTFIDNACSIVEVDGFKLLTDPWLSGGAFEGSWFHYPAITTTPSDVSGVDAIYISHLHPDHYDAETLAQLPKDIPVVIMDWGPNFLQRILARDGFTNMVLLTPEEETPLGPLALTIYPPFASDVFHEARIGNIVDSALVIRAGDYSVFHGNDNNPTLEAAKKLRQRHGRFTVAQLKYNAASPYPACFPTLGHNGQLTEANRIMARNLDHLTAITQILEPEYLMPSAGSFILGGKLADKNQYLGTCSWDTAATHINQKLPNQTTLVMREGQTFDLATGDIQPQPYTPLDWDGRFDYVNEHLTGITYPYEGDDTPTAIRYIKENILLARQQLWKAQQREQYIPDLTIYINFGSGEQAVIRLQQNTVDWVSNDAEKTSPWLSAKLDSRLFARILSQQAHWNNAEIGCHIDFARHPDVYHPDAHVMLSFLHVPTKHQCNTTQAQQSPNGGSTPTVEA